MLPRDVQHAIVLTSKHANVKTFTRTTFTGHTEAMTKRLAKWLAGIGLAILSVGTGLQGGAQSPPAPYLASVSSQGVPGNGWSDQPALSTDGRLVAFVSTADNLVPGDSNALADIFVHDCLTGVTQRVSISSSGEQANGWSYRPAISANGRLVAFTSLADNLVPGDTNHALDVFVHDRLTGQTTRVSVNSQGAQGQAWSDGGSISGDGRFVAFSSAAENLIYGDDNQHADVFLHDRLTGQTRRMSLASDGSEANGSSGPEVVISADGRWVIFPSLADTLAAGDRPGTPDLFAHHRVTGETRRITDPHHQNDRRFRDISIASDGRRLTFTALAATPVGQIEASIYSYDLRRAVLQEVAGGLPWRIDGGVTPKATLSGDGRLVALVAHAQADPNPGSVPPTQITVHDLTDPTRPPETRWAGAEAGGWQVRGGLAMSQDGQVLAMVATRPPSEAQQIILLGSTPEPASFTLSGQVTDPTGQPLRSVFIDAGGNFQTWSDRQGYFYFNQIPAGYYNLTLSKEGYAFAPQTMTLKIEQDLDRLHFTASTTRLREEAVKDLGMPYSFHRGCETDLEGCDGPYHGFYAGYCTDLILDAYRWGVDFDIQYALVMDALANPGHFYRWHNARNAQDMWRYLQYTGQVLDDTQPYLPGDILFFDWDDDGVIDHVSLASEVNAGGRPQKMLDATGVIEDNPSGLATELTWKRFHERTIRGHARWSGSYGAVIDATPADLQVLQVALDSPYVTVRLFDRVGHELTSSPDGGGEQPPAAATMPGGERHAFGTGLALSVISPETDGGMYFLEVHGTRSGTYYLHIQTLQGGLVNQYRAFNQISIGEGEVHSYVLELEARAQGLGFQVFPLGGR